jgi:phage-related baseplate assembly protein
LDRIVSVKDFEYFARAFSGIGKAQAIWLWSGEKRIVHLTVAPALGEEVAGEESDLYKNLSKAIDSVKDPLIHVEIQSFKHKQFNVKANLLVAEDRDFEDVKKKVREALIDSFSFEKREFSQDVSLSEVMAVIQRVEGVIAVDIDYLYLFGLGAVPTLDSLITAEIAHLENGKIMVSAELLTINPQGVILEVMMQP